MAFDEKIITSAVDSLGHKDQSSDIENISTDANDNLKYTKGGILLEPQPSDDPHDPFNFPRLQKYLILGTLAYWAFLGTTNLIIVGPGFFDLATNYNVSFEQLAYTVNGPLVAYGMGCFFWVPFANKLGVRLAFLTSSLFASLFGIWASLAPDFGQFVAARVVAAFFYAAPEAFGPQVVADVFFLHERATCTSVFTIFQFCGFTLAGLIGGFAGQNLGWRWPSWIMVILSGCAFVVIFLFFPETTYTGRGIGKSEKRRLIDNFRIWPSSGGGGPKVSKVWVSFRYPWYFLPHPVVLLGTAYFSLFLATNDYIMTTNSISYPTVYGFSLGDVALTSISPTLGNVFGIIYGGYFNDMYVRHQRKKHGGKFRPEMRLPMLLLTLLLGPGGLIIFGVGTQYKAPWVVPLIGTFMTNCGACIGGNIVYTYFADVYLERADAALVVLNGLKNWSAFGIVYAVTPWNTHSGYAVSFGCLAVILFLFHIPMLVLWLWGEQIRKWQAERFDSAKENHHGATF